MAKNACLSPNADICQAIAKKYNISNKDAATAINVASSQDDSITLLLNQSKLNTIVKELEKNATFTSAVQKYIPSENIVTQNEETTEAERLSVLRRSLAERTPIERELREAISLFLGRNARTGRAADSGNKQTIKQKEEQLEKWAKKKKLWVDNIDAVLEENYGRPVAGGGEAIVYRVDDKTLVKAISGEYYGNDPQLALDRILIHNTLFPTTALTNIGFGRDSLGKLRIMAEQPFIKGTPASREEIKAFTEKLGFKSEDDNIYTYQNFRVNDLNEQNVIKAESGAIAVIDGEFRLQPEATASSPTEEDVRRTNQQRIEERNKQIKEAKKLLAEAYPDLEETDLDSLSDMAERTANILTASKKTRAKILLLTRAFKDPRHIEFLGDWVSKRFSSYVTDAITRPQSLGLSAYATRQDVYKDPKAVNTIMTRLRLELARQAKTLQESAPVLSGELVAATQNLNTLLAMYGNSLFRFDGVRLGFNNALERSDSTDASATRNDSDRNAESDDDMTNESTSPVDNFSVSKQDQSVSSKIAPDIKRLLATIQEEGVTDEWGYGLPKYLDVPQAINDLLFTLEGCLTYSEMIDRLNIKATTTPWVSTLTELLSTATDNDVYTAHAKEQLQSAFYKSFRKNHTSFRTTFMGFDSNGDVVFKNADLNSSPSAMRLMMELQTKFAQMQGIPIIQNGKIDTNLRHSVIRDDTEALGVLNTRFMNAIRSGSINARICAEEENQLFKTVTDLGVGISRDAFQNFINNGDINTEDTSVPVELQGRVNQIRTLLDLTRNITRFFYQRNESINQETTSDTKATNPFSKESTFQGRAYAVYNNLIQTLSKYGDRDKESMAYDCGKAHYAWNNPTDIQTVIDHLKTKDRDKFADYIKIRYQSDPMWFIRPSQDGKIHFYADWLESIVNGSGRQLLEYQEKLSINGKTFEKQPDLLYRFSILADYFSDNSSQRDTALYRMLIFSDKPRYSTLRFTRYATGGTQTDAAGNYASNNYHSIIANKALGFFMQELRRAHNTAIASTRDDITKFKHYDIRPTKENEAVREKIRQQKKITIDDVVKDGKYIFAGTGADFHFSPFLTREIESKSDFGRRLVDLIFNTSEETFSGASYLSATDVANYKTAFHQYLQTAANQFFWNFERDGAFEVVTKQEVDPELDETINVKHAKYIAGNLRRWHQNDEGYNLASDTNMTIADGIAKQMGYESINADGRRMYFLELAQFLQDMEEYTYNNWLAKVNMMELFSVDPAFYGGTTNFQKRNAQNISAGYPLNTEATFNNRRVSDGQHRYITIIAPAATSDALDNIEQLLNDRADALDRTNAKAARQLRASIPSVIDKLTNFDSTDGQAYTSLTALRKHHIERGEWSYSKIDEDDEREETMTDEAVYRRLLKGKATVDDFGHVFSQIEKPFVHGFSTTQRGMADREAITAPIQNKNSEYMLSYITAFAKQSSKAPASVLEAIQRVMEESAVKNPTAGIDTVNMDSAQKVGNDTTAIDLTGLSAQEVYDHLSQILYEGGTNQYSKYVHAVPEESYKQQQLNPEHFKSNAQPIGSQMKILAINNIKPDSVVRLYKGTNAEQEITGAELRDRYMKTMDAKVKMTENELSRRLCINGSPEARKRALSNFLIEEMGKNQKYAAELREALSITTIKATGEVVFELPLDDEMTQESAEAMIYSTIRRVYYKEKMPGGPVVQAASWGKRKGLHIRFFDKEGHIMPTREEWEAKPENKGKSYKAYCRQNQGGPAYFEAQIPMPDAIRRMLIDNSTGKVDPKFYRTDGSWNMGEIRKGVPNEYLNAIAYRIPTESKYSMMPVRIVEFTEEAAGSAVFYPPELVVFSGSDFDIDKSFIELHPIKSTSNEENRRRDRMTHINTALFDLQYAALQADDSVAELFTPGDFSDMSLQSRYLTLAQFGNIERDVLDKMSSKEIKDACDALENLDVFLPETDITLHGQNSEAGQIIGMAAVGVTSHAFFSLYNDGTQDGSTTLDFRGRTDQNPIDETYTIIDNSEEQPSSLLLTGRVPIDPIYGMQGNLVGTQISNFVGASADAAKDPALARLNITPESFPIVEIMVRLGIPRQFACAFVAQPVVREVITNMKNESSFGHANLDNAIDKTLEDLRQIAGWSTEDLKTRVTEIQTSNFMSGFKTIRYSEIIDANFNASAPQDMIKMLCFLQLMAQQSQRLKQLDAFPRYNSARAMDGSSYIQRYASRKKLERLESSLNSLHPRIMLPAQFREGENKGSQYSGLRQMFPYVGSTIEGEQRFTDQLLLSNFKTYGHAFRATASMLGIDEDPDTLQLLHSHLKNYLLFTQANSIARTDTADRVLALTRDYPDTFYNTIEDIKANHPEVFHSLLENNSFINSIYETPTPEDFGGWTMLTTDVNGLGPEDRERYITDWAALLTNPLTSQLCIDTSIYFLNRGNGVRYSKFTPVHLMPLAVKKAIKGYRETYRRADTYEVSIRDFAERFCLNNAENNKIVPQFNLRNGQAQFGVYQTEDNVLRLFLTEDTYKRITGRYTIFDRDTNAELFTPVAINVEFPGGDRGVFLIDEDNAIYTEYSENTTVEDNQQAAKTVTGYSIKCSLATPLGIPGQMLEYTTLPVAQGSVFGEQEVTDGEYENLAKDTPADNTEPDFSDLTGYALEPNDFGALEDSHLVSADMVGNPDSTLDNALIQGVQQAAATRKKNITPEEAADAINEEDRKRKTC